jgi:hypothetical protein
MNLWAQPVKAISTNFATTKEALEHPAPIVVSETTPLSTTIVSVTTSISATVKEPTHAR